MSDVSLAEAPQTFAADALHACPAASRRMLADLVRYGLCSGLALGLDWGLLIGLVALGVGALPAAAISFCAGMALTYFGSILFVFPDRRGRGLFTEALGFVAIGVAGLCCNELLLWTFIHALGMNVAIAKAPTAICVFLFNFILRRALVFKATRSA